MATNWAASAVEKRRSSLPTSSRRPNERSRASGTVERLREAMMVVSASRPAARMREIRV